jgi:glycosyltransferase involved in cell wall biosynthesis
VVAQVLFIVFLALGLAAAAFCIFGALIYDIKLSSYNKELLKHPYSRQLRKRPLIMLIVLVNIENCQFIEKSLLSIAKSNYRKYEIVVASEASAGKTNRALKTFKKKYPAKKIKFARAANDKWQNLAKKTNAEYVAVLSAGIELEKDSLMSVMKYFALQPSIGLVVPHYSTEFDYTIVGLLRRYRQIIENQLQKPLSLFSGRKGADGIFFVYRTKTPAARDTRVHYYAGTNVIVQRKPFLAKSHTTQNKAITTAVSLLVFSVVTYAIYLAFASRYTALLALIWAGFSFYLILNIWADEYLNLNDKIRLSFLSPMASLMFYFAVTLYGFKQALAQPARKQLGVQLVS